MKSLIDRKTEEKKLQVRDEFGDGADEQDEIIDEEELNLLREMKDLKKGYRGEFDKIKNLKVDVQDLTSNIDSIKQQLVVAFEQWYQANFQDQGGQFEVSESEGLDREDKIHMETYKGESMILGEEVEDEGEAFKRAKKKVNDLHRAKKLERMGHK